MSWKRYEKGISVSQKSDGSLTFRLECWDKKLGKTQYDIVRPPADLSKAEMKKWLLKKRADMINTIDNNLPGISPKITFSEYYETVYLKKELNIKPKTREGYERLYCLYIQQTLGPVPLRDIMPVTLSELQSRFRDRGVGNSTRCAIHRLWRLVLQYAVEDRIIPMNPAMCRGIAPKVETKEQSVLTLDQLQRFIEEVDNECPLWRTLIYTEVFTGLRRGELAALTWEDMHLDDMCPYMHIDKNVVVVRGYKDKIGTPKTESSVRDLPIYEPLLSILKDYKKFDGGDGFVFKNFTDLREPINPDTITKHIATVGNRCGFKCTPHTLRRTLTSILDQQHVRIKVGQKILGHSSEAVTSKYYVITNRSERDEGLKTYYNTVVNTKAPTD